MRVEQETRFEELSNRGFIHLKQEEKAEYQALKAILYPAQHPEPRVAATPNEMITMSKKDLDELISQKLAAAPVPRKMGEQQWKDAEAPKKKIYTATLRKYRVDSEKPEGLIVDMYFHKNILDEITRRNDKPIYKVKLRYDDGVEEVIEMPLEEIAKITEHETVKILEQKKDVKTKTHGYVYKKEVTREGYTSDRPTDTMVELTETKELYTCLIERANGEQFWLPSDKLNS